MVRSIIAAFSALGLSVRYWRDLGIRPSEARRYLGKAFSLGLCYAAFVKPPSIHGSVAAGQAAYLCCAYDVVTDWRHFSAEFRELFQKHLERLTPRWAVELTMRLYETDLRQDLEDDGLERGVITVRLITGILGSSRHFARFGVRRLGLLLQIVDDLLDYEHDLANGELNCLATSRATLHLAFFNANRQQLFQLFRSDRIMRFAIERACRESQVLTRKLRLSAPGVAAST